MQVPETRRVSVSQSRLQFRNGRACVQPPALSDAFSFMRQINNLDFVAIVSGTISPTVDLVALHRQVQFSSLPLMYSRSKRSHRLRV